ncbi:MAG: phosphatidate cytidylyltransferase [Chloroflexi bacterium]|nr:phosphatidate cytidylyltransferase [Chloroflexota bacterium]
MSLRRRLLSSIILIPIILGAVYVGGVFYFIAFTAALGLAGWEFFQLAQTGGFKPQRAIGIALIVLLALSAQTQANVSREIITAIVMLSLTLAIFRHGEGWLAGWALTIAGALYIGGLGAYLFALRALPNGMTWTALALFTTWATDTFAFAVGTTLGRHPFFPHISPKKTWEGALGGLAGAVLAAYGIGSAIGWDGGQSVFFGAGIALAGMIGDLAESLIKRQVGAKDSGVIVPGHGGALDRLDSLLFSFAFAFYFVTWVLKG